MNAQGMEQHTMQQDHTTQPLLMPDAVPVWPSGSRLHSRRGWRVLLWGVGSVVLLIAIAAELLWWVVVATATNYPGSYFNQHHNAVWIAHTWVGDPHPDGDYDDLAARLQREQITSVYSHVGPLDGDGSIPPERYPNAAQFASSLHARDPDVQIYAWIGQIYRIGAQPGDAQIDIGLPETRQRITTTAAIFTEQLGFDGVHYDIEPIPNEDSHFLDLLDETRHAISPGKRISIATPNWVPIARVQDTIHAITNRDDVWWTTYYYQAVSHHVDQIVVMLYNTGMPTVPLYEAVVQQETAHILSAVQQEHSAAQVIFGIPTYTGPTSRAFHSNAENIRTGLVGVIAGLNYATNNTAFTGIAIYPEWLTTPADWTIFDQMWLGQ